MALIYKIVPQIEWDAAEKTGVFTGSPVDVKDGFIHFSTADQVAETANKHFKGLSNLLLITVDEDLLDSDALKYEISRGGDLFPHLYEALMLDSVVGVAKFEANEQGLFSFSEVMS